MENRLQVGPKEARISEKEELAILKAKNGKVAGTTPVNFYDLGYHQSFTGGISRSIWNNINPDWVQLRNIIETFFVNIFQWEGIENDFRIEMEKILFRHGKVAIIKLPNGDIYPAQFTWTKDDEDYYGNPEKITIVTDNKFNGKIFNKDRFVIIYNDLHKTGTLTYMWERMRQVVRSMRDVDNNSLLSRPKWGANISADDQAYIDVINAMNSDAAIVPLGNIDFREAGIEDLSGADRSDSMMAVFKHQFTLLLKLIGLDVNDGSVKLERQTEMEVSKNDEFDGVLLKDKLKSRLEKIEDLKKLGLTKIKLQEMLIHEEDKEEENKANGEVNKVLQEEE